MIKINVDGQYEITRMRDRVRKCAGQGAKKGFGEILSSDCGNEAYDYKVRVLDSNSATAAKVRF